jgi:GAF domain-containing protein
MHQDRETRLVDTFVTLTDSLIADYDVVEVLQTLVDRAVELFDAAAGAIHLLDEHGALAVVASTSERSGFIGLLQLDAGEGPCVAAFTSGSLVTSEDAAELGRRWPRFAAASQERGYAGVHAIPLRLRDEVIGSLNLFRETEGALNGADARAAQALADVATISVLQQRTLATARTTTEQLQRALDNRIVIEQAKGYLARAKGIDMDTAREILRRYARTHQQRLGEVASAVAAGELPLESLDADDS